MSNLIFQIIFFLCLDKIMFKYKVIVLLRKFQLYTYNWNWWKKIHSCMPLNFFLYSAKKDSVWRNKNFRVFLVLCYIRKLASLKIFHLQKALLLDITQKQKRKNNWLFFRFEQHRKKSIPAINSDWTDCTLLWCFFVKIHAHHFQLV